VDRYTAIPLIPHRIHNCRLEDDTFDQTSKPWLAGGSTFSKDRISHPRLALTCFRQRYHKTLYDMSIRFPAVVLLLSADPVKLKGLQWGGPLTVL